MSSPQGMTELRELMDQIRQLQAENEQLKAQGQDRNRNTDASTSNSESRITPASTDSEQSTSSNASGSASIHARYVYVPRERKCSKFTGKMSVDLLEGESLRDFSHVLKSLMDAVIKKTPGGILNHDLVLRDQFAENVNDDMLRRELKKRLALDPDMSFVTLRSIAIKWVEEGKQGMRTRHRAFSFDTHVSVGSSRGVDSNAISATNTEMIELKECLRRQQAQLDAILSQLNSSRPQANSRSVGGQSKTYQFHPDGRPICNRSSRAGHIAKYCRIEPNSSNVATQGVGQRAVAHNQLVESPAPLQPQEN